MIDPPNSNGIVMRAPVRTHEKLWTAIEGLRDEVYFLEGKSREVAIRLESARALLRSMEEFIEKYAASHAEEFTPADASSPQAEQLPPPPDDETTYVELRKPRSNGDFVAEFARRLLTEANRPLDRSEILEAILARGYSLDVTNPPKFIGKTLWGHKDFIHIDKRGYWLTGIDVPPAKSDDA